MLSSSWFMSSLGMRVSPENPRPVAFLNISYKNGLSFARNFLYYNQ